MRKIEINFNPYGDTRTSPADYTYEKFQKANQEHRKDVKNIMSELSNKLFRNGLYHDLSKIEYEKEFYSDFVKTMETGSDFKKGEFYQKHIREEKHHPLSYCHDDINLLDVIEMIVDIVCAIKSRNADIKDIEYPLLDPKILELAMKNTYQLIDGIVEIKR